MLNLIYSRTCPLCAANLPAKGRTVCDECHSRIPFIKPPICLYCGSPSTYRNTCRCRIRKFEFAYNRSLFIYKGLGKSVIYRAKEGFKVSLIRELTNELLLNYERGLPFRIERDSLIVPVPSSITGRLKRGYCLSEIMAAQIADSTSSALLKNCLLTRPFRRRQTYLDKKRRENNLRGSILITEPDRVKNRSIILADDVFTTGSTLNECARVLKKAGAVSVAALSLAQSIIE